MDTLNSNSLPSLIADNIANQIIYGELKPGEKIIEDAYAKEHGISRAPVREALYLLINDGLVERIPRKGTIVKGYSFEEVYDLLCIRMELEILAFKRILEKNLINECIEKMSHIINEMNQVINNHESYADLNQKFHFEMIKASKSEIISQYYQKLSRPLLTLQRISFLEETNIQKSLADHVKLVELLKVQETEKALELLNLHNEAVILRVKSKLLLEK